MSKQSVFLFLLVVIIVAGMYNYSEFITLPLSNSGFSGVPAGDRAILRAPDPRAQPPSSQRGSGISHEAELQPLLTAINTRDNTFLNEFQSALITRAQQGDTNVVKALLAAVKDQRWHEHQDMLVQMLGEIATPAALAALLELTKENAADLEEAKNSALAAIAMIGQHRDQAREGLGFRAELSPLLEQRLDQVLDDPVELAAIARGISSIGTSAGVGQLLDKVTVVAEQDRDKIAEALTSVRNPAAIAPLEAQLQVDSKQLSPAGRIAGSALAAMGKPAATQALLQWAAKISQPALRQQALEWFQQVRDEESLQMLLTAGQHYSFRDKQLRDQITAQAREMDRVTQPVLEMPEGRG